jgi:diguanylate cyclase (GGDEF)-like protein
MSTVTRTRRTEHGAFIVDRSGTILGFDQAMEGLTGWPAIDIVGRNKQLGRSLTRGAGAERQFGTISIYEGEIPLISGSKTLELTLHCRDGRVLQVEASAQRLDGPGERLLVTVLRILARSPGKSPSEARNRRDPLTGLPNPDAFAARLTSDFMQAAGAARPLALVLADVDHLREINDRHGWAAGDQVLQKFAGILRVTVEDESRLCRLGDDDFAILLPNSGRGEARQLAASLRSMVERYRFFNTHDGLLIGRSEPAVTVSLGAASFPADAENGVDLMDRARDALNEARSMGRNRVWCYLRRPRVPLEVPVFFDGAESLLVGYTRDLSPSGIFVQTSVPMEIGMRCALAFPLPGKQSKVHVIGRVVRTVPAEFAPESQAVRVPGMGVEFERFGGSIDRRSIEAFLHRHELDTRRPEVPPLSF